MSFFKKLLGREDLSPVERERINAEKQARQSAAQEKQLAEERLMEKYFGRNLGFFDKMSYSLYLNVIRHFEQNIMIQQEQVIAAIPAEFDKTKKREIKGMLIATNERLIFVTSGIGHGQFVEIFEYRKINGISLAPDGLGQRELLLDYGRSRRVFDDILNNDQFNFFINTVMNKMNEAKRNPPGRKTATKKTPQKTESKYEQLAQIAKLRDQGILTEAEFQKEKEKILRS